MYQELNDKLTPYKTGVIGESTEQALTRLAEANRVLLEFFPNESGISQPEYFEEITEARLHKWNQNLGWELPPSYKEFVLKKGLFKLGDVNRKMVSYGSMDTLKEVLEDEVYASLDDLSDQEIKRLESYVRVAYGDEEQQLCWSHFFDLQSLNSETGEMTIIGFDQDEWDYFVDYPAVICQGRGFDLYLTDIVNEEIEFTVSALF